MGPDHQPDDSEFTNYSREALHSAMPGNKFMLRNDELPSSWPDKQDFGQNTNIFLSLCFVVQTAARMVCDASGWFVAKGSTSMCCVLSELFWSCAFRDY